MDQFVVNIIHRPEMVPEYAEKVTEFLNHAAAAGPQMSVNALQKGILYREEAVALKAIHYYNNVIAKKETQKKRNIRLLPAG